MILIPYLVLISGLLISIGIKFSESTQLPELGRSRRNSNHAENQITHLPVNSNSSSLYIKLLVVYDHSQYVEYKENKSAIVDRTLQVVNIMNAFYRQLNIFIALVGVVPWIEKDEIEITEDGDKTLNNFLKYRYEKLLPKYEHDNAQLITSTSFNGSVVGKALKGPICTHELSGGVNTAHSHNPAIVAVTLAHELGHNLGMEHDEDEKCKCPDEKCIMSASSSSVHPKHWSSCSIDYLNESRRSGLLDCLTNAPEKTLGPVCGNGFVEDGEDCDLGELLPTYGTSKSRKTNGNTRQCLPGEKNCGEFRNSSVMITNPCCDRRTCKFVVNATCAQGPCCDLTKCSIFDPLETRVCRQRKTECDFEEICDGTSEYCPPDVYYHDGIECQPTLLAPADSDGEITMINPNRSRAFCFNGRCASHESQCQLLWGNSAITSKDICFEQNIHGNASGNCGHNRQEKSYTPCEEEDALCGMLHCVHDQTNSQSSTGKSSSPSSSSSSSKGGGEITGKLNYGFESASTLLVSSFMMPNNPKIYCHGAIIDAGPKVRDPGLVPNGAYCGGTSMCLDQKCVPVEDVLTKDWCPSDCNGNGICDNMGVCHCNDGTIGSSCFQFFSSNFHLSMFLYIVVFFAPLVALIFVAINHYRKQIKIWWFLHNRKMELRSRDSNSHQRTRLSYSTARDKIIISDPIPLHDQSNINRPFYEAGMDIDPWAETSYNATKVVGASPGFRLEPINKQQQQHDPFALSHTATTDQARNLIASDQGYSSSKQPDSSGRPKPVRAAPNPPTCPPGFY